VKLVGFDDRGKVRLSMKDVDGYVDPFAGGEE
jgi:Polyribonucleotide nucleotidyltransferase (polynucleotide phosphorylase)